MMKISTFLSVFSTVCLMACAQDKTEIKLTGDFGDAKPAYINVFNTHDKVCECKVQEDGSVIFETEVTDPFLAVIGASEDGRKPICNVIIDGESMEIQVTKDGCKLLKGSEQNKAFFEANDRMKVAAAPQDKVLEEYHQMHDKYGNDIPDSIMDDINKRYDATGEVIISTIKQILSENTDNMVPIYFLLHACDDLGAEYVENYLKNYKYKDNAALEPVYLSLSGEKNKVPGATVIDFVGKDLQGKECHLAHYVGKDKYVLVDFWASWCGPCRAEMPNVKACYEKYHDKGFNVIGISLDDDTNAWAKAVADLGITWPQMSDLRGWQSKACDIYNIKSIPSTILYSPDGKVLKVNLRGEELEATLKQYLDK